MVVHAFMPTSLVIDAILKPLGLDQLPPLEAAVTLDFEFCGRGCLVAAKSTPSSSLGHLVPRVNLGARLETQRGLKSTLSDCDGLRNYVNTSLPGTIGSTSDAVSNVLDCLRDVIDFAYTPSVVLAHLVRSLATLELPDRLCSIIISAGSSIPVCGHQECIDSHKQSLVQLLVRSMSAHGTGRGPLDDKITISLDSDLLNLLNPTKLVMTVLPILSTLVQSHGLTLVRRLPVTLSTQFYRRRLLDARPHAVTKSRKSRKKSTLPRMLKRKASTRLLSDVGTAFAPSPTSRDASVARSLAFVSLERISKERDQVRLAVE